MPVPGFKVVSPLKFASPVVCKVVLLKIRPPPEVAKDVTLWVRPDPRFKVPPEMVSVAADNGLVETVVPPAPLCLREGRPAEAKGIKVCGETLVNSKVPLPAIKVVRERRSTVLAATCKVEEPKSSPPPVMEREVATVWIRPVPMFKIPEVMVKVGAVKALVETVVVPVPFWWRFSEVKDALGVKACEFPVTKVKVLEPEAVTVMPDISTLPLVLTLEVPKSSPPLPLMDPTLWVKPDPRFKVPEVKVRLPALVRALV